MRVLTQKQAECPVPTTGPSSSNTWGVGSSISQLPSKASCTKLFLEVPATHRNISRPLARCWHTCRQSISALNWAELRKCMGQWGCQYLRFYWGPMHQIFGSFLRHIGTFLDYLGGGDTPAGRVPVPKKWTTVSKYMGSGELNISASIKASCTTFDLEVSETHRNISRQCVRCWLTCRKTVSTQNWAELSKC